MAIPNAKLPGHKRLLERANDALGRCQEAPDIDFKQSAPWDDLKETIIKTAMAMANRRDGGIVIVGVSETNSTWNLDGIADAHFGTFDPDVMISQINTYASPAIQITVAEVGYGDKRYLAIEIPEFEREPIVCQRNGGKLVAGALYVRPSGTPRSERPSNALELRDLLELAAEKRARAIIEGGRRVGLVPAPAPTSDFEKELRGL